MTRRDFLRSLAIAGAATAAAPLLRATADPLARVVVNDYCGLWITTNPSGPSPDWLFHRWMMEEQVWRQMAIPAEYLE
jgi:hypothetical protein